MSVSKINAISFLFNIINFHLKFIRLYSFLAFPFNLRCILRVSLFFAGHIYGLSGLLTSLCPRALGFIAIVSVRRRHHQREHRQIWRPAAGPGMGPGRGVPFKITLWPSCSPNTLVLCINKRHESPWGRSSTYTSWLSLSLSLPSASAHLLVICLSLLGPWLIGNFWPLLAAFGCLPSKFGQLLVPELWRVNNGA